MVFVITSVSHKDAGPITALVKVVYWTCGNSCYVWFGITEGVINKYFIISHYVCHHFLIFVESQIQESESIGFIEEPCLDVNE